MRTALIIFILTYVVIAIQNVPRVHISRPAGSLIGAVSMVLFGVLSMEEACAAIDFNTILFILGMMIIAAYLEVSGFFGIAENYILRKADTPVKLLFLLIFSAGIFSSLFMNDTVCLMFAPIVLRLAKRADLAPAPYLIALATSSNIGSVMTVIGNPQNMLIGLYSGIPFLEFLRILFPVSLLGLAADFLIIKMIYKKEINSRKICIGEARNTEPAQKELLVVSLSAIAGILLFLSLGFNPPAVAISFACFLILAGAARPRKVLEEVDWTLLLLFSGLFIVMKGIEKTGITGIMFDQVRHFIYGAKFVQIAGVSWVSALTSNVISNVPAVILFSNVFSGVVVPQTIWLALAMSSTLAGNLTIIGSIANIIVFESARDDTQVGFFEYFKVGLPITLVTMAIGIFVLIWRP